MFDGLVALGLVVGVGLPLWGIVDAAGHPASSFERIGSNKARWIALIAVLAVVFNLAGIVTSIVYLTSARPRLRRADAAALEAGPRSVPLAGGPGSAVLASDGDRERVTERLHHHFEAGRLTLDEHNQRVEAALQARTLGDLSAITIDLPGL